MLIPTPLDEQRGSTSSLKRPVGTWPMADTPEHSFIAEETLPLERRRKKKAKGKQQEPRKEPTPPPAMESGASSPLVSPLVSPMHTSPNLTDDEVILAPAPVADPAPFGPPLPPGSQRVDIAVSSPPPSPPNTLPPSSLLTPGSGSKWALDPWEWRDATPPGTPYDSCSGVDI